MKMQYCVTWPVIFCLFWNTEQYSNYWFEINWTWWIWLMYHINPLETNLINARRPLRWRHNGCDSVSNHQHQDCLLNRLFRHRSKKTSKLRVTGLYAGNSPGTGEFPAQRFSKAENVSSWWRHHAKHSKAMRISMAYGKRDVIPLRWLWIKPSICLDDRL